MALAKSSSSGLTFGTGGTGSTNHLAAKLIGEAAGAKLTHVPYKGASEFMNDLLGSRIDFVVGGSTQSVA